VADTDTNAVRTQILRYGSLAGAVWSPGRRAKPAIDFYIKNESEFHPSEYASDALRLTQMLGAFCSVTPVRGFAQGSTLQGEWPPTVSRSGPVPDPPKALNQRSTIERKIRRLLRQPGDQKTQRATLYKVVLSFFGRSLNLGSKFRRSLTATVVGVRKGRQLVVRE